MIHSGTSLQNCTCAAKPASCEQPEFTARLVRLRCCARLVVTSVRSSGLGIVCQEGADVAAAADAVHRCSMILRTFADNPQVVESC